MFTATSTQIQDGTGLHIDLRLHFGYVQSYLHSSDLVRILANFITVGGGCLGPSSPYSPERCPTGYTKYHFNFIKGNLKCIHPYLMHKFSTFHTLGYVFWSSEG